MSAHYYPPGERTIMLDREADVRQSRGDLKTRYVRGRC
jgi:hypothetical protein